MSDELNKLRELEESWHKESSAHPAGSIERRILYDCHRRLEALLPALEQQRIDTQRMWDLVRYKRQELHTDGLISDEEYAALAEDHPAVKRLENYDKAVAALEQRERELREALQAAYDFYMGEHACGDFTCNCGNPEVCGICEMRAKTRVALNPTPGGTVDNQSSK